VYQAFEDILAQAEYPEYKLFQNTGLDRVAALDKDLAWFKQQYGVDAPALPADSPGLEYAKKLHELAKSDPPAFICHYYNYYFAHTAGGRMIGSKVRCRACCSCRRPPRAGPRQRAIHRCRRPPPPPHRAPTPLLSPPLLQVSSMILDNAELEFYKYNGDVGQLLDAVRREGACDRAAAPWGRKSAAGSAGAAAPAAARPVARPRRPVALLPLARSPPPSPSPPPKGAHQDQRAGRDVDPPAAGALPGGDRDHLQVVGRPHEVHHGRQPLSGGRLGPLPPGPGPRPSSSAPAAAPLTHAKKSETVFSGRARRSAAPARPTQRLCSAFWCPSRRPTQPTPSAAHALPNRPSGFWKAPARCPPLSVLCPRMCF
jgi:hypothetical protein